MINMTDQQINLIGEICKRLQDAFLHFVGIAIFCGIGFVILLGLAMLIDDYFFEDTPISQSLLILGILVYVGIKLL